ncbi:MAG: 2-succinyl-5-enolpyruvyl-6-hydroxy-3-cyclohexene-1-carboxylate synthase [Maribacter sp.]|jgi:2-succinyl-5-enolpyruvyl-6-hydroxy-3-cyclohexene-1-carboxylate synthase
MQLSDKHGVRNLVEICAAKGIRYVIISPGSRNAPLNISFNEHGAFTCLSIPDERCAAFVALGIAQQTRMPAIVTCTSGSASLNFAPAISEAYYQRIPLLILTADRPDEWINQGEGQSIQQKDVYHNYIQKSYHLHLDTDDKDNLWSNDRMICEAIDLSIIKNGPVHINIPFREPLYNKKDYYRIDLPKISQIIRPKNSLPQNIINDFVSTFHHSKKILILCGLIPKKNKELNQLLNQLSDKAVILAETTSNISGKNIYNNTDALLTNYDAEEFAPDLLITIGHSFISKKIKLWLRASNLNEHWHLSEDETAHDVFKKLTKYIKIAPELFLKNLINTPQPISSTPINYQKIWQDKSKETKNKHHQYLEKIPWSDFKLFAELLPQLPLNTNLHMGNSSPVRYIQLFPIRDDILYNGNRGVSGIDGSTSTAAGAALIHHLPTTLITGDIAFFYDSNAFWSHHLTRNLRVIVINNQGGGIFRLIPGPPSTNQLGKFFETTHDFKAKGICDTFHIPYYFADSLETMNEILPKFYAPQENNRPAVLEIQTPREINDKIFKEYYKFLNSSISES